MAEWNFPNNNFGSASGIANAGIETFGGKDIQSLARETCQNSLDAVSDSTKPVEVEFECYRITPNDIPGANDYSEMLMKCLEYWKLKGSVKAVEFLSRAVRHLKATNNYVLRISDYNTIGLGDPYGSSFDGWNALVKLDGGATKNGDEGGSFGIGKNAPFCSSLYRLVFYRTLNKDMKLAAQGISRLTSYAKDFANEIDTMTTGIGYYGNPSKNMPVSKIQELDSLYQRTKKGTDLFIYGFNNTVGWEDEIITAILDSFVVAIFRNNLIVKVNNHKIDSKYLEAYVEKYGNTQTKNTMCVLKNATNPAIVKEFTNDFHKMGIFNLKIYADTDKELKRKIIVVRRAGMKVLILGNFSRQFEYTGVLEIQGEELSKYFREMETPAHDKWLYKRHNNPEQAKKYFEELKEWIRVCIDSIGEVSADDETEVKGLGSILQERTLDKNEKPKKTDEGNGAQESIKNDVKDIKIYERQKENKDNKGEAHYTKGEKGDSTEDVPGVVNNNGEYDTTRTRKGTRHRKTTEHRKGNEDPEGQDIVHKKKNGGQSVEFISTLRVIKVSAKQYQISFVLANNIAAGYIDVGSIGENGKKVMLQVTNALAVEGISNVAAENGKIKFYDIHADQRVKLKFELINDQDYTMEIKVNENN